MRTTLALAVAGAVALGVLTPSAVAASGGTTSSYPSAGSSELLILERNGTLSRRNADLPLLPSRKVHVRGLRAGDRLVGIDTRPATGQTYAIGRSGQLYRLDAGTGKVTTVGAPVSGSEAVGFDFNPVVDRIRLVTAAGQNLRLHPDTGAVAAVDGNLAYAAGQRPEVAAAGYTDSFAGTTTTGLYVLDARRDTLATQGSLPGRQPVVSPNTGQLFTVGRLGLDIKAMNGFDISGRARTAGSFNPRDYHAVAAVETRGLLGSSSRLVRVDLATGRTTPLLALGLGDITGLTFLTR